MLSSLTTREKEGIFELEGKDLGERGGRRGSEKNEIPDWTAGGVMAGAD